MTLFPYGRATSFEAECARLTLAMGSDPERVHDGPFSSIGNFIQYAQRIPLLRDGVVGAERPIVLLTQTSPLMLRVVQARRTLEAAIPALTGAAWALFVDPIRDPEMVRNANALGTLSGPLDTAPLWHADDRRFLVLSPAITVDRNVQVAVALLDDQERRARGR
jgi:hypothetical protein